MQKSKKAIQLSFNFIFSLIIVAVVIFVGIWAIKQFLELKDRTTIQAALKDIEDVIQEIWQSTEAVRTETFFLPNSVSHICFINYTANGYSQVTNQQQELKKFGTSVLKRNNLFIIPFNVKIKYDVQGYKNIKCGSVSCLVINKNICCENKRGKVRIKFEARENKVYVECA